MSLRVGNPAVTAEKVALFDSFHAERSRTKGWPIDEPGDIDEYMRMFVVNPFPTQEWCYFLGDVLVGVGYVDLLAGGLSAIYFARDPSYRDRSLGTWNVLSIVDRAAGWVCRMFISAITPRAHRRYVTKGGSGRTSVSISTEFGAMNSRHAGDEMRGPLIMGRV